MTHEDILKMARKAGFMGSSARSDIIVRLSNGSWVSMLAILERFHALAVAAEREACLRIADECAEAGMHASMAANAIRARSQQ